MQLAVASRFGYSDMDQIFMDEFGFVESFSSMNGKLLICGDYDYWVDDPAHKPCCSEFMELL